MGGINAEWEVSVQQTRQMLNDRDGFVLLDVRNPDEHSTCRIEGALLFPLSDLANRLDELRDLAEGKTVVAHCHHGGRSLKAAALLREAGLGPVKSMAGGIDAWSLEIDPSVPRY
ncbi:putative adenylyltransferase/sulfurtransferase MoeZ [Phycisphaerae bacterium RAS2]|nr:putative adenylyltransferase/sulfurtransferase MoeZ [Phycisphaerae bacterium RAS2]